jgi:hypothetical protein
MDLAFNYALKVDTPTLKDAIESVSNTTVSCKLFDISRLDTELFNHIGIQHYRMCITAISNTIGNGTEYAVVAAEATTMMLQE